MSLTEQVIDYLARCDMARVKQYNLARDLGINTNALERRLKAEGTRYSTLSDMERKRRLANADLPDGFKLKDIADVAGYSGHGPARLFLLRAYGMTIEQYRAQRA